MQSAPLPRTLPPRPAQPAQPQPNLLDIGQMKQVKLLDEFEDSPIPAADTRAKAVADTVSQEILWKYTQPRRSPNPLQQALMAKVHGVRQQMAEVSEVVAGNMALFEGGDLEAAPLQQHLQGLRVQVQQLQTVLARFGGQGMAQIGQGVAQMQMNANSDEWGDFNGEQSKAQSAEDEWADFQGGI